MPFRAGQHVTIESPYVPWRSAAYSMANAPRPDRVLEFHVCATRPDGVSGALVERLKPGDTLRLGAPRGLLTLDPYSRRDLVFVAVGPGVAAAKALEKVADSLAVRQRDRTEAGPQPDLGLIPAPASSRARTAWSSAGRRTWPGPTRSTSPAPCARCWRRWKNRSWSCG